MAKSHIGTRIRAEREARGLSIGALANRAEIAQSTLSLIEAGSRPTPGLEVLLGIARGLSSVKPITLDELTGFDPTRVDAATVQQSSSEFREVAQALSNLGTIMQEGFRQTHELLRPKGQRKTQARRKRS
jgi:transcriptional regulator with XRE-family HTH domain